MFLLRSQLILIMVLGLVPWGWSQNRIILKSGQEYGGSIMGNYSNHLVLRDSSEQMISPDYESIKALDGSKRVKIILTSGVKLKGLVNDSMLEEALLDSTLALITESGIVTIEVNHIQNIKWRRSSNDPVIGAVIGGLTGALIGALGYASSQTASTNLGTLGAPDPQTSAAGHIVGFGLGMAAVGAIIGNAVSIKQFPVYGNFNIYKRVSASLTQY